MTEENFDGITVDVCATGCKGIWFDCHELSNLDHRTQEVGQALQEALAAPRVNDANRAALVCPKCDVSMHQHQYKSEKEVNVDECYNCGGFFLDSGELKPLRDAHMSEDEESAYAQKLIDNLPVYAQGKADQEKVRLRNLAFARFTQIHRRYLGSTW